MSIEIQQNETVQLSKAQDQISLPLYKLVYHNMKQRNQLRKLLLQLKCNYSFGHIE